MTIVNRVYKPTYRFPSMGVPPNGWFTMENPMKMDDSNGYPHFRKPPHIVDYSVLLGLQLQYGRVSDAKLVYGSNLIQQLRFMLCSTTHVYVYIYIYTYV